MNNESMNPITNEKQILVILADFAEKIKAAAITISKQISEISGSIQEPTWKPEKIKWIPAEGASGPYERSEDVNNLDFKALLKDLAAHQGKLAKEGYFYWAFRNGYTVGRKKRQNGEAKGE